MKLLKFSLPNCVPCKTLSKQMEELDLSSFEVEELNLFDNIEMGAQYGIRNVPMVVVLNNEGFEIGRIKNIEQVKELLENELHTK
jgi:thioredoxin-like negative regulator of GroEL